VIVIAPTVKKKKMCETACRNTARGKQGDPGVASYLYVAYASDASGANFSLTPSDTLKFRQEIILHQPATTLTIADFPGAWIKYIGNDGAAGIDGAYGGFTIPYKYRSNTSNSNPGAGNIRFNNTDFTLITEAYVSEMDNDGTPAAAFLAVTTASTNPIKSYIKVYLQSSSAEFAMFAVTGRTDNGAWETLNLTYINSSATTPLADQDQVLFSISVAGDVGATGAQGVVDLYNNLTPVSSTGSGSAEVLMTYTLPANEITTNGSKVKIRIAIENRNGTPGDMEFAYVRLSNDSGANVIALANIIYTYNAEVMIAEVEVNRINSVSALLTASGITANLPLISSYSTMTWDWTATTVIDLVALDVVSGPPLSEYVVALQLYVEKIIK